MKIGELAGELGVNAKTIRYYEEIALLPKPDRDSSGYRTYGPDDVARLRFIKQAQKLNLRLDEIREILHLRDHGQAPCGFVREVASLRLIELDKRIAEMLAARDELTALLAMTPEAEDASSDFCPLIERHALTAEPPASTSTPSLTFQ